MGKVMRHTLGASLNIRHNLSSSKRPKPLQLKLLTTSIPNTSAFTLAFSTSQRLRTTGASARTLPPFRRYIAGAAPDVRRKPAGERGAPLGGLGHLDLERGHRLGGGLDALEQRHLRVAEL